MQAKSVAERKGETNGVCALLGRHVTAVAEVITAPSNSPGRTAISERELLWLSNLRLARGIAVD